MSSYALKIFLECVTLHTRIINEGGRNTIIPVFYSKQGGGGGRCSKDRKIGIKAGTECE